MNNAKITVKQGEAKRIILTVKNNGAIMPLTGASVRLGFKRHPYDTSYSLVKEDATFNKDDVSVGVVSVFLDSNDLNLPPWSYVGELRVAFSDADGTIEKSIDFILEVKQAITA